MRTRTRLGGGGGGGGVGGRQLGWTSCLASAGRVTLYNTIQYLFAIYRTFTAQDGMNKIKKPRGL